MLKHGRIGKGDGQHLCAFDACACDRCPGAGDRNVDVRCSQYRPRFQQPRNPHVLFQIVDIVGEFVGLARGRLFALNND
jgi:hypothetical protein